jgi:hypothetical protein
MTENWKRPYFAYRKLPLQGFPLYSAGCKNRAVSNFRSSSVIIPLVAIGITTTSRTKESSDSTTAVVYPHSPAALVTSSVLDCSGMVRTRAGCDVFYSEESYGRAARRETTRQRKRRKFTQHTLAQECSGDNCNITSTPRRSPRKTRAQI